MIRTILAGAIALALLHACAPRQPPGGDLWRVVQPQR
jgi:hypothetical protein